VKRKHTVILIAGVAENLDRVEDAFEQIIQAIEQNPEVANFQRAIEEAHGVQFVTVTYDWTRPEEEFKLLGRKQVLVLGRNGNNFYIGYGHNAASLLNTLVAAVSDVALQPAKPLAIEISAADLLAATDGEPARRAAPSARNSAPGRSGDGSGDRVTLHIVPTPEGATTQIRVEKVPLRYAFGLFAR
jgi:hypothetical protein